MSVSWPSDDSQLATAAQRANESAETTPGAVRHFCLSRHCSLVCFLNGFRLSDRTLLGGSDGNN